MIAGSYDVPGGVHQITDLVGKVFREMVEDPVSLQKGFWILVSAELLESVQTQPKS